tara:strand:+ start:99 stop:632 length:534 start_codon:yes stop_codon:yes gene_type:complete
MSDMFHDLPLSNRQRQDESTVTGDWRSAEADVVRAAHVLLSTRSDRDREPLARSFLNISRLGAVGGDDLAAVADAIAAGGKRRIRDLSRTVTAALALSRDTGMPIALAPRTSGAVALYLATSGSFDVRAVVRGHTLRSTDDGWEFGKGPAMEDTSTRLIAFLCGVSQEPPRLAPPRR